MRALPGVRAVTHFFVGEIAWTIQRAGLDRRRTWRYVGAVLAVALLGPGRPLLTYPVGDHAGTTAQWQASADTGSPRFVSSPGRWVRSGATASGSSNASAASKPIPAVSKRTAFIVGINRARGGRPLPGSVTDATNLRTALLGYGFQSRNITMLLDGAASRGAILGGLDALARRTPKDGVAVFAIATHTRRRGGQNELLTGDGLRVSATELASRLGRVRSPMWVALPTCYAAGYALPGIVGRNRVATFASSSSEETYQLGNAGSYLFIHMVRDAMVDGEAPDSVEDAFAHAKQTLERESPNRVPLMSDGVKGELRLGKVPAAARERADAAETQARYEANGQSVEAETTTTEASPDGSEDDPPSSDDGSKKPSRKGVIGVCGRFSYNCSHR